MRFRLEREFFGRSKSVSPVVRVVFLDKGFGSWQLVNATDSGPVVALTVQCQNSGTWAERTVELKDAVFDRSLDGKSDLILRYVSGDDTIFHMIELNRQAVSSQ